MVKHDDADPVKAAKAAAAANVAMVEAASRSQARVRDLAAQLAAAQTDYAELYKAVTAAWGKTRTEEFGLAAPEQLRAKSSSVRVAVSAKAAGHPEPADAGSNAV